MTGMLPSIITIKPSSSESIVYKLLDENVTSSAEASIVRYRFGVSDEFVQTLGTQTPCSFLDEYCYYDCQEDVWIKKRTYTNDTLPKVEWIATFKSDNGQYQKAFFKECPIPNPTTLFEFNVERFTYNMEGSFVWIDKTKFAEGDLSCCAFIENPSESLRKYLKDKVYSNVRSNVMEYLYRYKNCDYQVWKNKHYPNMTFQHCILEEQYKSMSSKGVDRYLDLIDICQGEYEDYEQYRHQKLFEAKNLEDLMSNSLWKDLPEMALHVLRFLVSDNVYASIDGVSGVNTKLKFLTDTLDTSLSALYEKTKFYYGYAFAMIDLSKEYLWTDHDTSSEFLECDERELFERAKQFAIRYNDDKKETYKLQFLIRCHVLMHKESNYIYKLYCFLKDFPFFNQVKESLHFAICEHHVFATSEELLEFAHIIQDEPNGDTLFSILAKHSIHFIDLLIETETLREDLQQIARDVKEDHSQYYSDDEDYNDEFDAFDDDTYESYYQEQEEKEAQMITVADKLSNNEPLKDVFIYGENMDIIIGGLLNFSQRTDVPIEFKQATIKKACKVLVKYISESTDDDRSSFLKDIQILYECDRKDLLRLLHNPTTIVWTIGYLSSHTDINIGSEGTDEIIRYLKRNLLGELDLVMKYQVKDEYAFVDDDGVPPQKGNFKQFIPGLSLLSVDQRVEVFNHVTQHLEFGTASGLLRCLKRISKQEIQEGGVYQPLHALLLDWACELSVKEPSLGIFSLVQHDNHKVVWDLYVAFRKQTITKNDWEQIEPLMHGKEVEHVVNWLKLQRTGTNQEYDTLVSSIIEQLQNKP